MSYINNFAKRIYGGATPDAGSNSRGTPNIPSQDLAETLQVSSTANNRRVKGPQFNGHYCFHMRNVGASGAGSTLTVWYSNLPDPDVTNDAHWVQDTNVGTGGSIDLTAGNTGAFVNLGNINAEWVRFKPAVLVSAGSLWLYVRSEGPDNR